jgi:hypothetical protein
VKSTPTLLPFTHKDLSNSLFNRVSPYYTSFPFFKGSFLENTPITYSVFICDTGKELYNYINKSIYSIGKEKLDGKKYNILDLDVNLFSCIVKGFVEGVNKWQQYLVEELKSYSKTPISEIQWKTLKRIGGQLFFKDFPTFEQQLWIVQCENNDKELSTELIMNVRESVLPFLNAELYKKEKDYKANRRENVEYEKQREDMLTGKFFDEDLDVIK